jgi:putative intracellular protease/amidase
MILTIHSDTVQYRIITKKEANMSLRDANACNPKNPKRIAIVLSNPALSTTTGWPVGFWWSELTHPYYEFTEAD